MSNINSTEFFKLHWLFWKILGAAKDRIKYKTPYLAYAMVLNTLVTLLYPVHVTAALLIIETQADIVKSLAISVTCMSCSIKFIIFIRNLKNMQTFEAILTELDARVQRSVSVELKAFDRIRRNVRNIAYVFFSIYATVGFTAELSFVFREERSLLYPAWLPFDWQHSMRKYYIANLYQIGGISCQILQNYVNDCFPPMALCLLSGHIALLGNRVSKIGYDCANREENERELLRCIKDQKNLYKLFDTIQAIISWPLFIQLTVTAFNICVAMAALLFYVSAPFDQLYYLVYFLAMPMQIFPACYYGSNFQMQFGELQYNIFSCNWVEQSPKFRKHMILFSERALKKSTAMAGGMLRIHLDTFFATCKGCLFLVCCHHENEELMFVNF